MIENKITKKAGCILVNKNNKTVALVNRKGEYSLPKGHLEENETLVECAIRETKEETGHKCHIIETEPISTSRYITKSGKNVECTFYFAIDEGITYDIIDEKDKEKTEWISYNDVEKYLLSQNLKDLWNEVKERVEKIIEDKE